MQDVRAHLPPGPSGRISTTFSVMRTPYDWYEETVARWGRTFLAKSLNGDLVITGEPDFVRRIFAATESQVKPFALEAMTPVIGEGSVLLQHGDPHRRSRSVLMPAFAGERMTSYSTRMRAIVREELASWVGPASVSVQATMFRISLRVIVETVFGARPGEEVERLMATTDRLVKAMHPGLLFSPKLQVSMLGLSPWDRFVRARRAFSDEVLGIVASRRAGETAGDDILSVLLATRDEAGEALTDRELVDQLVTLLVAGHETTSIAMSWAVDWVLRTPGELDTLRASLDAVAAAGDEDVDWSASRELGWVIRETLRLWPIVPETMRTLKEPMQLGEWTIPAGHAVAASAAVVHMDPDLYPEPSVFRPSRWSTFQPRPWEYLPFGGGIRRCIGASFATHEMAQVLGEVFATMDLELLSSSPPRPERRSVTMAPSGGVPVRARYRAA